MPLRAKNPYTTVGTPARTSSIGLTIWRVSGLAYSLQVDRGPRARAGSRPAIAISVMMIVAVTSGSTPYDGLANSGVHWVPVKNSVKDTERKNSSVGMATAKMIPIVVATDTRAAAKSRTSMRRSPYRGRDRRREVPAAVTAFVGVVDAIVTRRRSS